MRERLPASAELTQNVAGSAKRKRVDSRVLRLTDHLESVERRLRKSLGKLTVYIQLIN